MFLVSTAALCLKCTKMTQLLLSLVINFASLLRTALS
jgi:hypothetical protein